MTKGMVEICLLPHNLNFSSVTQIYHVFICQQVRHLFILTFSSYVPRSQCFNIYVSPVCLGYFCLYEYLCVCSSLSLSLSTHSLPFTQISFFKLFNPHLPFTNLLTITSFPSSITIFCLCISFVYMSVSLKIHSLPFSLYPFLTSTTIYLLPPFSQPSPCSHLLKPPFSLCMSFV